MVTHSNFYGAMWCWKDDHLTYHSLSDVKEKVNKQQTRQIIPQDTGEEKTIYFLENVDQNNQRLFKQKYQRNIKPDVPNIVTIQDIKDVVTFLMVGTIPKSILALLHCYKINNFFRALIVYLQLYLQVWDDLIYRKAAYYQQRLKHPISVVRENLCKTHLIDLRRRIGQEYALLIAGEGMYKRHHHMNNTINRSYTTKDLRLYEYLFKFSARVVWVALYRSNYKEIEAEISRLFIFKKGSEGKMYKNIKSSSPDSDANILQGDKNININGWHLKSPVITDVFFSQEHDNPTFTNKNDARQIRSTTISGLEAALTLPEELLVKCGIIVGILGESRDNFEAMLHIKQGPSKSLEEEEIEKGMTRQETEKPLIKMYEYIRQLDTAIDFNKITLNSEMSTQQEIQFYLSNHLEDSKKAFSVWKDIKVYGN